MSDTEKTAHPLFRRRITTFLISAFFLVFTVILTIFFLFFCRIKTVSVKNNLYSAEESIISAADITLGDHIYAINKTKIAERIIAANPYVREVRIKRTSYNTVCITVTEDTPRFYTSYGEKCLILSENMRILAEYDGTYEKEDLEIYPITLPELSKASVGKTAVFADEARGKECINVLSSISEAFPGQITGADISKRFDMRFTYKDKYEVRLGSSKDLPDKIEMIKKAIDYLEDASNGYAYVKGIIHASVSGEASFEATGVVS